MREIDTAKNIWEDFIGDGSFKMASEEQVERRKSIPREGNSMHRASAVRISLKRY